MLTVCAPHLFVITKRETGKKADHSFEAKTFNKGAVHFKE